MWISGFWLPWRDAAAVALLDVGGSPGAVEVVDRDAPVLDVGSHPHLLRRPHEHRDVAGSARLEQAGFLGVVARLVDEPDRVGGQTAGGEQRAELVVGVPPLAVRGREVAEHDLQPARDRRRLTGGGAVDLVAVLVPEAVDGVGGVVELAWAACELAGDQAGVERGFAAVGGDLEHVVLLRRDEPGADGVGAARELVHVGLELGARVDQHRLGRPLSVGALGELGGGELQILGGLDVGEHVPQLEHFGDVLEAGEAGVHPVVPAAGRGDLDLGHGLPERRRPRIEVLDPRGLQEVGAQVAGHHVRFGDAVRDRGGGRHRRDPIAVAVAEPFELHVQIACALRAVDRGVADVGDGLEVLVVVGLVDDQVVDPGLLERQPRISRRVEQRLEAFLLAQDLLLQPLHGQSAGAFGVLEHRAQLRELAAGVVDLGVRRDRQSGERGAGQDHRVPVVRRGARDERAAPLAGEIVARRRQHAGLRVELQPLAGELLEHVVGHDHGRLCDEAEAAELHRAHHHLGGLAGADLVKEPDGGLGEHPGDRGPLVRSAV